MERFVGLLVAGGLALLAGVWTLHLTAQGSPPWLAGAALAALGVAGLAAGIGRELDLDAAT